MACIYMYSSTAYEILFFKQDILYNFFEFDGVKGINVTF